MSRKANPTLIGGFVLGAAILVVAGLLLFGGGQFLSPKASYVMYFSGSVSGLHFDPGDLADVDPAEVDRSADVSVRFQRDEYRRPA